MNHIKLRKFKANPIVFLFLALLLWSLGPSACASPIYGVDASGQAGYELPLAGIVVQFLNTNGILPQTSYGAAPIELLDSVTFAQRDVVYTDTATADIFELAVANGQLHGWVQSSASNLDQGAPISANASAHLLWLDILYVGGFPVGTPVRVELKHLLDGSLTYTGDTMSGSNYVADSIVVASNSIASAEISLQATYLTPQPIIDVTEYGYLDTFAGDTLTLEAQLGIGTAGGDLVGAEQGGTFNANANLANTAITYLDVLTPGATLTSASGVNYSTPSAVPEPATWVLIAAGLGFLWHRGRKARSMTSWRGYR